MANVLPWSYSSLSAFESCQRRFYLTRIAKVVTEKQTQATIWVNLVHKALEDAVAGTKALAPNFTQYQPLVDKLRAVPGKRYTEGKFGLTNSFKPTSFFGKDVWFRGVIDLAIVTPKVAVVLDHKTGKVKSDGDQLKLFAAATFAQHPYVEKVKTGYIWLAHDKLTSETFTKDDVPMIWQEFLPRVQRMEKALEADKWMPNPTGLCGWCPVGKANCEFWKGEGGNYSR